LRLITGRGRLVLLLAVVAAVLAGCGTAPPCNVEPAQVDQARVDLQAAQADAQQSADELARLESELAALRGQTVSADELAELEQRLEELKKGSGR
jgi:septal ring factor EnvC (AmiA/AmiB activator)